MNSLKTTIRSLAVVLGLCLAQFVAAKQPHITAKYTTVAASQTSTVYDQSLSASDYTYLETHAPNTLGTGEKYWTNGATSTTWYDKWVKNRVVFYILPENSCINEAFTATITVELKKYNWYGASYTFQTENKTLTINYDPANVFSKKAVYEFPAGYKLVSRIISLTTSNSAYNSMLNLETEFEAERYFEFSNTVDFPTALNHSTAPVATKTEYLVTWDEKNWAEEYDLEWTYIDYYSELFARNPDGTINVAATTIPANHNRFNSTRVTTTNNYYNIPAIYGKGIILYRVRGYGKSKEDQFVQKVAGVWSINSEIDQPLTSYKYIVSDGHELNMNWEFETEFAEEGRNKVALKYFDGSMRERQELTKMNTGIMLWDAGTSTYSRQVRNTIVSETMYDHQGREAISVLPVPTDQELLRFYDRFNRNPIGTTMYDKLNFDIDRADPCAIAADEMSNSYGASKYYSANNVFLTSLASPQMNKTAEFIPDAQKYPFIHTQYMPDNTGKVLAKSGSGKDHQIGTGHETRNFYGRPFQEELDRLFGSEAGYAEHYQKNVTMDANGQLSTSYLDMNEKVIATTLTGPSPNNVIKVETYKLANDQMEVDLLNKVLPADRFGKAETFKVNDRTRTLSHDFFVADDAVRDFRYKLTNDKYTEVCVPSSQNFCYECVLDLKISIKNECGVEFLNGLGTDGSSNPVTSLHIDRPNVVATETTTTNNCQGTEHSIIKGTVGTPWKSNTSGTPVIMKKGTYTLNKTLTVNQAALDIYTKNFLDNNQCFVNQKQTFINEEKAKIDTSFCTFDCSEWLAKIGSTWASSPLNPAITPGSEITEAAYNILFNRYKEQCDETNRQCKAAYEMMLQDVSPLGQYGEVYTQQARYDDNGKLLAPNYQTFSPQYHPLSVFNENNYLPWKEAIHAFYLPFMAGSGMPYYWPSWRFPYNHNESDPIRKTNYLDENGEIAYVYLERNADGGYTPAVYADDYSLVELYQGKPRILVKYLADVKAMVDQWDPAWAKSLVVHHPEYMFYIDCISKVESNKFDNDWLETQSVTEADAAFISGYRDWRNPLGSTPTDTPGIVDPFFNYSKNLAFANNPGAPTGMNTVGTLYYNAVKYKLDHFIVSASMGIDLTMQQAAIIIANCPDIDLTSPGCGSALPSCLQGRINISTPEEWRVYRQLYFSVKQRAAEALSIKKSIESGYYNGCIGEDVFNIGKNWFYNTYYNAPGLPIPHPWFNMIHTIWAFAIPKIQFFNPEQPCNWGRYWLYKDKNVRYRQTEALYNVNSLKSNNANFALDPGNLLTFGDDVSNMAIIDEVKNMLQVETYKANCGQCPVAENMVQLLNSLKGNSKLVSAYHEVKSWCNTGTDYSEITPELGARLFPGYDYGAAVEYKGEQYNSGGFNYLKTTFRWSNSAENFITYKFPAGSPYNASDIVRFCCIRGNTSLANKDRFDFKVSVFVKIKPGDSLYAANDSALIATRAAAGNPILREIMLDATSAEIDLIHCDNLPLCRPSEEALHLLNFLNGARDFVFYNCSKVRVSVLRDASGFMGTSAAWQHTFTDALAKALLPGFNSYFNAYTWSASPGVSSPTMNVVNGVFEYKSSSKAVKLTMLCDPALPSLYQYANIKSFNSITPKMGFPNIAIIRVTLCNGGTCKLATIEMDMGSGFNTGTCTAGLPDRLKSGQPANNNEVAPEIGSFADFGVSIHASPYDTINKSQISTDSVPPGGSPCTNAAALKNFIVGTVKNSAYQYDSSSWTTEWNPCPFGHGWVASTVIPHVQVQSLPCSDCALRFIFPSIGYVDAYGNNMPYTMNNIVALNEFRTIGPREYEMDVTTHDGKRITIRIRLENCNLPDSVTNIGGGGNGGGTGGGSGNGKCKPTEVLNFHNFSAYYGNVPAWDVMLNEYILVPGLKYYFDAYEKDFTTDLDSNRRFRFDTLSNPLLNGEYSLVALSPGYKFLNYGYNDFAMRYRNTSPNAWDKVWESAGSISIQKDIGYTFSVWHKEIFPFGGINDPEESEVQIFFADTQVSTIRTIYRIGNEMWVKYDALLLSSYDRSGKVRIETKSMYAQRDCMLAGIQLLKDCGPTFCCPMPMYPVAVKNPCHEQLESIALENANIRYQEWLKPIITNFQQGYINKCLNVYEEFYMKYEDSEDHTTLYYYDQAGNLVRTIPPKGVVKITDAGKLARIREDRAKGLRREFTDHEYKTTYTYNSLNQLQHQSMPDNDNMPIWNAVVKSNIIPSGYKIKDIRFTDKLNGILVATNSAGGHIYKTVDGGENWTEVNAFGLSDLNSMAYDQNTGTRYVVGDNGLIMQYVPVLSGAQWNIKVLPTAEKLVKINLISSKLTPDNSAFVSRMWVHDENGTAWLVKCTLENPTLALLQWEYEGPYTGLAEVATGKIEDVHIPYENIGSTSNLIGYAVTDNGKVYRTDDGGYNWVPDISSVTLTDNLTAMHFNSSNQGYIGGANGLLLKGALVSGTITQPARWRIVPGNLTTNISKLHFIDADKGFVLGADYNLYRTTDAGITFTDINIPDDVADFTFGNTTTGVLVTRNGKVYRTTDAGITWTLYSQIMNGGSPFYTVGGTEAKRIRYSIGTTNTFMMVTGNTTVHQSTVTAATGTWTVLNVAAQIGANTITDLFLGQLMNNVRANFLLSDGNIKAYAMPTGSWTNLYTGANASKMFFTLFDKGAIWCTSGQVKYYNSATSTWENRLVEPLLNAFAYTPDFANLIVIGNGGVIRASEGAAAASMMDLSPNIYMPKLNAVQCNTPLGNHTSAIAVSKSGLVMFGWKYIGNNYTNWTVKKSNTAADLNDVTYVGGGSQYTVAGSKGVAFTQNHGTVPGTVTTATTTDYYTAIDINQVGGTNGLVYNLTTGSYTTPLTSSTINDGVGVYVVGDNGYMAERSGSTYTPVNTVIPQKLNTIFFVNASLGYTGGETGSLWKTTNGGKSWKDIKIPDLVVNNKHIMGISFINETTGFVVATGGKVYKTTNGETFSPVTVSGGTTNDLMAIDINANGLGYIVGLGGACIKTTDWGATWTYSAVSGSPDLNAVTVPDYNLAYACGDNSKLYKLTPSASPVLLEQTAGTSWPSFLVGAQRDLKDIHFIDRKTGYATGAGGFLMKTVDGGTIWQLEQSGTTDLAVTFTQADEVTFYLGAMGGGVSKITDMKDRYSGKLYYDAVGRMVVSQNTKQYNKIWPATGVADHLYYGYNIYDQKGRVIEVGELHASVGIEANYNSFGILDDQKFQAWISASARTEVTRTFYDVAEFGAMLPGTFTQNNLRNRVSSTAYYPVYSTNSSAYQSATHYTYDIHGNVSSLLQENTTLLELGHQFKRIDYSYDLISDKVLEVAYQHGSPDRFYHRYSYDGENRITSVETSYDRVVWEKDAKYLYNLHGPVSRTELGNDLVQGMDYAYTMQGWVKSVNGASLNLAAQTTMGSDGVNNLSNANRYFGKDEIAYELDYYNNDYIPVASAALNSFASITGTDYKSVLNGIGLYNGNISGMITAHRQFIAEGKQPLATTYLYDQLSRLQEASYYRSDSPTVFSGVADYFNEFSYDANGNITQQFRNGSTKEGLDMDDLFYQYYPGTNRLRRVDDAMGKAAYADDVNDQLGSNNPVTYNNYEYDAMGNLVKDKAEEIDKIEWTLAGKISKIIRTGGSLKPDLEFLYDPAGNRIVKIVSPKTGEKLKVYTFYVRDAQGNVMSTYTRSYDKDVNFSGLNFSTVNTAIINAQTLPGFAAFINWLHVSNNNSNSSFFANVKANIAGNQDIIAAGAPYFGGMLYDLFLFDDSYDQLTDQEIMYLYAEGLSDEYALKNLLQELCQCYEAQTPSFLQLLFDQTSPGIGDNSPREIFLTYLYEYDNNLFFDLVNNMGGSSYDFETDLDFLLQVSDFNDWENGFASVGLIDCDMMSTIFAYGYYNSSTYAHSTLFGEIFAYLPNIKNELNPNASSCGISLDEQTVAYLIAPSQHVIDFLVELGYTEMTDWLMDYATAHTLNYTTNYDPGIISLSQQQTSGIYGGMEGYFNLIKAYFGDAYYQNLKAQLMNSYPAYLDKLRVNEQYIYGTARVGSYHPKNVLTQVKFTATLNNGNFSSIVIQNVTNMSTPTGTYAITRGQKQYELNNHLGNVLAVVSDRKTAFCSGDLLKFSDPFTGGLTSGWSATYQSSLVNNGSEQINVKGVIGTCQITSPMVTYAIGKQYRLSFDLLNNTPGNYLIVYTMWPHPNYTVTWIGANGHYEIPFTAYGTNMQVYFNFQNNNNSAAVTYSLDNVQIHEINGLVDSYTAQVLQANDYSPFGAPLAGRSYDRMEEASRRILYNDQFTGATNGWLPRNSITLTHDNGRLKCASSATWGTARKVLNLVNGKQYKIRFRVDMGTATALNIPLYNSAINLYVTMPDVGLTITQSGVYEGHFTANDNTMNFLFEVVPGNPTGATFWLDDVVVEEDVRKEAAYVFGFNGMEKDEEVSGDGNAYTTTHREYDPRIGRWWTIDPEEKDYPDVSPYCAMDNNPLRNNDPDGDDWWDRVAGATIGVATNILPNSTGLRNLYTPNNADDYNNTLEATDKVAMSMGAAGVVTGGGMMAAGGTMAAAGGTVSLSGIGATVGVPTAAAGGAIAAEGFALAAGGGLVMANASNNQKAGYNYGKSKQQTSPSKPKQQTPPAKPKQQTTNNNQVKKNVTKVYPSRKAALEARPKPKPAQPGKPRVTNQTRNKAGEGNKFKTDGGKQTPHVHDRNHNSKTKPNVHYRVGTKKIKP